LQEATANHKLLTRHSGVSQPALAASDTFREVTPIAGLGQAREALDRRDVRGQFHSYWTTNRDKLTRNSRSLQGLAVTSAAFSAHSIAIDGEWRAKR
jgi:hypothetical protein